MTIVIDNEPKRMCFKCEQVKLNTDFYRDGRPYCKDCERTDAAKRMREYGRTIRGKASQALQTSHKTIKQQGYKVFDDLTVEQIIEVFEFFDGVCAYCETKLDQSRLSMDHIIPLSKGGANTQSNIVVACQSCNKRKHDKEIRARFNKDKHEEIHRYSKFVSGDEMLVRELEEVVLKIIAEKEEVSE
ncbi:HNH endonuclease [Cytobacillus horneckiae]|uniref:HNH endonuclease n=1 Tax=Cytobacillus horneckiae TaxID=549687 RepID=A0A2N0ZEA6_9BACI|nr:HNH endonuclease signature motif containing protein [Cytobacillus horneckiae]MEC1157563.1 HNH endonuclease [Cytobacillus horneckiae]MED2939511.1 HNH endonuclease [Cytobacillus horneckiae]PKG27841.1 HNH endonuclease [Cytobacillus horneckiae]